MSPNARRLCLLLSTTLSSQEVEFPSGTQGYDDGDQCITGEPHCTTFRFDFIDRAYRPSSSSISSGE